MALEYGGEILNGLGMLGFKSVVRILHEFVGTPHIVHVRIKKAGQFLWWYWEMTSAFLLAGHIFSGAPAIHSSFQG